MEPHKMEMPYKGVDKKSPNMIFGWLSVKCPRCRTGRMFVNKNVFPLKDMMKMPVRCHHCGQKMEPEPGFYYGTGYMSYALTIALIVFNSIWWALFVGFSWEGDSIFYFFGISVFMLIVLQPWLMRLSRVMYIAMFVKYDKNHPIIPPSDMVEILQEGYTEQFMKTKNH